MDCSVFSSIVPAIHDPRLFNLGLDQADQSILVVGCADYDAKTRNICHAGKIHRWFPNELSYNGLCSFDSAGNQSINVGGIDFADQPGVHVDE